jgi:hypothetical protein
MSSLESYHVLFQKYDGEQNQALEISLNTQEHSSATFAYWKYDLYHDVF